MKIKELKKILNSCVSEVSDLRIYCDKCLGTRRWGGSVPLMIIDAAFTSIGLNYFTAVVPKVIKFKREFVNREIVKDVCDLSQFDYKKAFHIWKNKRSWKVIREISEYLCSLKRNKNFNDRKALRYWAKKSNPENFKNEPIGRIKGVGIVTFQYLRMMGGIDTVMPDKIVKRVLNNLFKKVGIEIENDNLKFIYKIHEIGKITNIRPIDMCWMTWLIQKEGKKIRIEKYKDVMKLI